MVNTRKYRDDWILCGISISVYNRYTDISVHNRLVGIKHHKHVFNGKIAGSH